MASTAIEVNSNLIKVANFTDDFCSKLKNKITEISSNLQDLAKMISKKSLYLNNQNIAQEIINTLVASGAIDSKNKINPNTIGFVQGIDNTANSNNSIRSYEYRETNTINTNITTIQNIDFKQHNNYKPEMIKMCSELCRAQNVDFKSNHDRLSNYMSEMITKQIINIIKGGVISPITSIAINKFVNDASEKFQKSKSKFKQTLIEQVYDHKRIDTLKLANNKIANNNSNNKLNDNNKQQVYNTIVITSETLNEIANSSYGEEILVLAADTAISGQGSWAQLGTISKITNKKIEVYVNGKLETVIGGENKNQQSIKLKYIEPTLTTNGHWESLGKVFKSSNNTFNCLYDAIAEQSNLSSKEVRIKTATYILQNPDHYRSMMPVINYFKYEGLRRDSMLMVGGSEESTSSFLNKVADQSLSFLSSYQDFHTKHPTIAKYLGPSINVLAKGAIGGAIGSTTAGPLGTVVGFASGALKGVYDEVSASLISTAFEEDINNGVEIIVDKAANRLRAIDSSLDEEKSRAIALSVVVAASSASEFFGIRANVLKVATSINCGARGGVNISGIKGSNGSILDEKNGIGKYISAFEGD